MARASHPATFATIATISRTTRSRCSGVFPRDPGGNSGVLLHTSTPDALNVWPKSLEAQLNHKNAGDIWVIGTTCEIENADKRVTGRRHFNLTDDSEKPIGEWNDYKIELPGRRIDDQGQRRPGQSRHRMQPAEGRDLPAGGRGRH